MLAALLKRGCQVNAPTNDGWTALHEAAANGHALIVDKLLASGAQASPSSLFYMHPSLTASVGAQLDRLELPPYGIELCNASKKQY